MPGEPEGSRPRVVLDSNVIISGLAFTRGNPADILDLLRTGEIEAYISPFIMEEVTRSFREDFDWSEPRIEEAMQLLRSCCIVVDPEPTASVEALTPADNRILDCVMSGQDQYLVTGDRGIQRTENFQGTEIISPAEFLGKVQLI